MTALTLTTQPHATCQVTLTAPDRLTADQGSDLSQPVWETTADPTGRAVFHLPPTVDYDWRHPYVLHQPGQQDIHFTLGDQAWTTLDELLRSPSSPLPPRALPAADWEPPSLHR